MMPPPRQGFGSWTDAVAIPQELYAAVFEAQPSKHIICPHHLRRGGQLRGCRGAKHCAFSHGEQELPRVPFASFSRVVPKDRSGRCASGIHMNIRVPVAEALKRRCQPQGASVTNGALTLVTHVGMKEWDCNKFTVTTYCTHAMSTPVASIAAAPAEHNDHAPTQNSSGYLVFVTDIDNALNIIGRGFIQTVEGEFGTGIYGVPVQACMC